MEIKIKKINKNAKMSRGSDQAAGYDLYAVTDAAINPHECVLVGTGLIMQIPEGYFGGIYARSGLASKQGLRPANCVGVVDSDYRGEVKVALRNDTNEVRSVSAGERIAQIIIQPYLNVTFVEGEPNDTERGAGGFGSTGM